jgi:hypothetical protein
MAVTELTFTGGERLLVEGDPPDVEARILSAARGSLMELAWLTEDGTGRDVGINPEHLLMIRAVGEDPAG